MMNNNLDSSTAKAERLTDARRVLPLIVLASFPA